MVSDTMSQYKKVQSETSWDESDRTVTQMGYLGWRPRCLEVFNKPWVFVIVFGVGNFFKVLCYGIFSIIIPTLESVFNLSSSQTGLILMANDLSGTIAAILLANYCSARKIRWIAIGMWIVVISALIPASTTMYAQYPQLKHAEAGFENDTESEYGLCNEVQLLNDTAEDVTENYAVRNHRYYWMHVLGSLLQGIGATPPGIAGSTYMDEIFTQKSFGVAISLLYIVTFVGFPISMIIGSAFLTMYVTLQAPEGMTQDSKEWVGAWWMGLAVPACAVLFISFFTLLFPRQMPAAKEVLKEKIRRGITTAHEKKTELARSIFQVTRDMVPAFKRLSKNVALDYLVVGDCFMFLHIGAYSFFPKIYSLIFRISPEEIGPILGPAKIVGFVAGLVSGGIFMKKKTWGAKKLQLIYTLLSLVSIPFLFGMLLYCPKNTYAGVDVGYLNETSSAGMSLQSSCNSNCSCTTAFYEPVCDNGVTFFSPCHAGCHTADSRVETEVGEFRNCTCTSSGTAVPGECGDRCMDKLWISLTITSVGTMIRFSGFAAHAVVYQRIVSEVDRTLAQGVRQTATRLLGTLPSPLIFGWILDKSCIIWKETTGTVGNCQVYDVDTFMLWFIVTMSSLKLISCFFYLLCWYHYPANIDHAFGSEKNGKDTVEEYDLVNQNGEEEKENQDDKFT